MRLAISPFCKNYTKLYFDAKHLKKEGIKGGEIFGALFFKKRTFLANTGRHNSLE